MNKEERAQKAQRASRFRQDAMNFLDDRAFRFYDAVPTTKQHARADVQSLTVLLLEAYLVGRADEKASRAKKAKP